MIFKRFLEKHLCLVVQMLCDSSDFSPSHILGCAAICERAAGCPILPSDRFLQNAYFEVIFLFTVLYGTVLLCH